MTMIDHLKQWLFNGWLKTTNNWTSNNVYDKLMPPNKINHKKQHKMY